MDLLIMDLVGPILDIVKCIAVPGCKYVDYHRKLEDNMDELKRKLRDLNNKKDDVESRIEAELQWGTIVKKEVKGWFEDVRKVNERGELLEQTVTVVSCFCRAKVGKKVCKLIEEVKEVYQRGSFLEGVVIGKTKTTGVTIPTTNMEGEMDVKEKIWEYLMGDNVGMIGVCGMGGIGKTTIMKHINNQLLNEATFEKVIWITVSKEFNVAKVQDDIAHGMKKRLPHHGMERDAALTDILSSQRRYVLILDDVWEAFALEDVGIPKSAFCNGSKLVLTSRSIEVCRSIGCEIVTVQPLSNQESLNLFIDRAECDVLIRDPDLQRIVELIVEECAGLPLAIITVAGSMKGVEDIREWRNAFKELRERVGSVNGMDVQIFEQLKFSFDRLKDPKLQNCFLYCALYPEDFEIPRDELIEFWIVEGLIDEFESRQEMHDRGHSILNRLENNCLLERKYGGSFVKMHDVVRDMALHIKSSGSRYMVKAGLGLLEMPSVIQRINDVEKLSLMENDISEIPPSVSPSGEILSTLLLQGNDSLKGIPRSFFEHMHQLKVLDLSDTQIEELPDSISNLEKLTALLLRGCDSLRYVPSLAKLKLLQKLDLFETSIGEVPQGMHNLVNLRCLEIYSERLMEFPTGILPELTDLQQLVLGWGSASAKFKWKELIGLKKLEAFTGEFNDMQDFKDYVKYIQDGGPSNYQLRVGNWVEGYRRPGFGKEVRFCRCDVGGEGSLVLPNGLQYLEMYECSNLRSLSSLFRRPTDLQRCDVYECNGIECVLDLSSTSSYSNLFHSLEVLKVLRSENLRALMKLGAISRCTSSAPTPPAIFPNLKVLELIYCHGIKKLFSVELVQHLKNLEEIMIHSCKEMEEIIVSREETQATIIFTFPKLRELSLYDLPKLMSICTSNGALACDSLQHIQIKSCQNLKRIPLGLRLSLINLSLDSKEQWESLKRNNPNVKSVFLPLLNCWKS